MQFFTSVTLTQTTLTKNRDMTKDLANHKLTMSDIVEFSDASGHFCAAL